MRGGEVNLSVLNVERSMYILLCLELSVLCEDVTLNSDAFLEVKNYQGFC